MPIPEFKLGADPELGIIINGRIVRADRVVHTWNAGRNQFGLDGAASVAEIRPAPAIEPAELVENIKRCLRLGAENLWPNHPRLRFKAGSMAANWPIGGHIHIGCSAIVNCRSLMGPLSLVLDTFLAPITLLLDDPRESVRRRGQGGYGRLGDHREQQWGMEYRTPGSWITSPAVSMGIMSLVRILTHDFFEHGVSHEVIAAAPDASKFAEYDTEYFTGKMGNIHEGIQRMSLYPRYAKEVEFLFALVGNHCSWFPGQPMLPAWGLIPPANPTVPVVDEDDGDDIETPEENAAPVRARRPEAPVAEQRRPEPVIPTSPVAERALADIWGELPASPAVASVPVGAAVSGATEQAVFAKRMTDGTLQYARDLVSTNLCEEPAYFGPDDNHVFPTLQASGFHRIIVHAPFGNVASNAMFVAWARDANGQAAYFRAGDTPDGFMMVVNQVGASRGSIGEALARAVRLREECDVEELHVSVAGG